MILNNLDFEEYVLHIKKGLVIYKSFFVIKRYSD